MSANALTVLPGLTPATSIAISVANPTVWYPMHEGAGATLGDQLQSGPAYTLGGTLTNAWSAAAGALNFDAAGTYARNAAANALVDSVFAPARVMTDGAHLVFWFEYMLVGAASVTQQIWWWGLSHPTFGGWGIDLTAAGALEIGFRGEGDGTQIAVAAPSGLGGSHAALVTVVGELYRVNANTIGFGKRDSANAGALSSITLDITGKAVTGSSAYGLGIGCRNTAGAGQDRLLGTGSGGARMDNFGAQRRSAYDASLSSRVYADLRARPRELPLSLRG